MARTATLVPSAFLREARFVSEVGHLSDSDIARATGAAPSTARAWLAGTRAPTGERAERLVELSALVERLTRVIDPSYIAVWLRKPVPALDGGVLLSRGAAASHRVRRRVQIVRCAGDAVSFEFVSECPGEDRRAPRRRPATEIPVLAGVALRVLSRAAGSRCRRGR